jgi:hypothetical protein
MKISELLNGGIVKKLIIFIDKQKDGVVFTKIELAQRLNYSTRSLERHLTHPELMKRSCFMIHPERRAVIKVYAKESFRKQLITKKIAWEKKNGSQDY